MPKSDYADFNIAASSITDYIVGYYNQYHPHQLKKGLSPESAEQEHYKTYNKVASFS